MLASKVLLPLAVASFVVGSLSFAYAQTSTMPNTPMNGSPNGPAAATAGNGVSSQTPTAGANTGTGTDASMNNASGGAMSPTTGMPTGGRTPRADRN